MGFSFNFTKVTRGVDAGREVLFVEGVSEDPNTELTDMYINLAEHNGGGPEVDGVIALPPRERLRPVPVQDFRGARDWSATFADGPLPEVDQWVFVVGEAVPKDEQPSFVWAQTLRVDGS